MAEGHLRREFLRLPTGTELRVPDFRRLLDDAVVGRDASTATAARSEEDVARSAREDLEAFRIIAAAHGFTPILVELAIFNDELLQIAIDPSERVASDHPGGRSDLEFLSVSASYEEFSDDAALLRAWHRGSRLVVDKDKESTVGEKRTYDYAYLWDYLDSEDIKSALAIAELFDGQPEPLAAVTVDDLANVLPPVTYPLGLEAARRIKQHWGTSKSRPAQLDEALRPEPRKIVHNLMSYFAAAACYEKSDAVLHLLAETVLLVVPFTRPWLFRTQDSSKYKDEPPTSRPGGGVFMLLKVDDAQLTDKNLLETSLTELSSALDYVVFQAAMLEAQQQHFITRETDLSLFGHALSAPIRQATTDCTRAVVDATKALGGDSEVLKYLNTARESVLRLEQAGRIARTAVLMRSGKAAPYSFSRSVSFPIFQNEFAELCALAMFNARAGIRDPARMAAVTDVTHEPIDWPMGISSLVKTDNEYLAMLIYELMRNALRHGDFHKRQQIEMEVSSDETYIYLELMNPIQRDQKMREKLIEMLSRKNLSLGITQIEMLARTYRVPLPFFSVSETHFSVKCVIAKKVITILSSTSQDAE